MKKPPCPVKNDSGENVSNNFNLNGNKSQCTLLLNYLKKHKSCSSIEATHNLDIVHPPRRIADLRSRGHIIDTIWSYEPTPCGRLHKVGRYHLIKEASV